MLGSRDHDQIEGTPAELAAAEHSLTGQHLAARLVL
jgi:hypothetical protein